MFNALHSLGSPSIWRGLLALALGVVALTAPGPSAALLLVAGVVLRARRGSVVPTLEVRS